MALTKTFIPLRSRLENWKIEKKNNLYLNVVFRGQIKKKKFGSPYYIFLLVWPQLLRRVEMLFFLECSSLQNCSSLVETPRVGDPYSNILRTEGYTVLQLE